MGNGNHCDFLATQTMRTRLSESEIQAYYDEVLLPAGHIPTTEEGKERLEYLQRHGDTSYAFSFKHTFPKPMERIVVEKGQGNESKRD